MLKIVKWFQALARSNTLLPLVALLSLFLFAQASAPRLTGASPIQMNWWMPLNEQVLTA